MSNISIGSGDKIIDGSLIVGAGLLFFKTADILSYFAPQNLNDIFGFDVSLIYGVTCALLVEGLALALHFNRRATLSATAQTVKWTLLVISGVCQVFDGFVVTNTLAQQSDTMKAVFSYGVPLVPLLIMTMVFGIGRLPEIDHLDLAEKKPFIGLKGMWGHVIHGGTSVAPSSQFPKPAMFEIPTAELSTAERSSDTNPMLGAEK